MKHLLSILLLVLSGNCLGGDIEEFGEQLTYFYLEPTEANFIEFQTAADEYEEQLKSSGNGADLMLAVMTARISEKYGWPIQETFFSKEAEGIVNGSSELAHVLSENDALSPSKLDFWWASFFATGEDQYLQKILRYAGEELPKGDIERMLVIGAATWSFKANCKQHRAVRDFAQKAAESEPISDSKRKYLIESVAYADSNNT